MAVDGSNTVYVADTRNGAIRKISPSGVVTTLTNGIYYPLGVAADGAGNVYVTTADATILKITPAGIVTTLAGTAHQSGMADGVGAAARFYLPTGAAVDSDGNVYVTEAVRSYHAYGLATVRKITADGVVTTVAGLVGVSDYSDGLGATAHFANPFAVAVDRTGNLYVADSGNQSIRIGSPAMRLISAVSEKTHGTRRFDVNLPLSGAPGVECRSSGGNHTLVFAFNTSMVSGNVSVTSGTAGIVGNAFFDSNIMTVNLSNVIDAQTIIIALDGITDHSGSVLPRTRLRASMLVGDTDGNRMVNASDVSRTKAKSGAVVSEANFREDVAVNGSINASDILQVKANVGHALPNPSPRANSTTR